MDKNQQLNYLLDVLIAEKNQIIEIPEDFTAKMNLFRALVNTRPPIPISDEFLEVQDEFLKNENQIASTSFKKGINLWQGDITTLKVDAIVNAANSKLLGCFIPLHNCIDNIIHTKAGIQLRRDCSQIMASQGVDEDVGKAKITNAYNLPAKYVIHTVGPAIMSNHQPTQKDCELLESCYKSVLAIADQYNLNSIAFCCISTGVFNFPQDLAAKIAIDTVKNTEHSIDSVIFDVFSDEDYLIYKNILGD